MQGSNQANKVKQFISRGKDTWSQTRSDAEIPVLITLIKTRALNLN